MTPTTSTIDHDHNQDHDHNDDNVIVYMIHVLQRLLPRQPYMYNQPCMPACVYVRAPGVVTFSTYSLHR